MTSSILQVTDASFEEEVLNSEVPVLLDFWAEWCGPCKSMLPVLDELSKDHEGKVKIYKMDVDNNPDTPAKYGVRSIPTVMLFNKGEITGTSTGAASKVALTELIESSL